MSEPDPIPLYQSPDATVLPDYEGSGRTVWVERNGVRVLEHTAHWGDQIRAHSRRLAGLRCACGGPAARIGTGGLGRCSTCD